MLQNFASFLACCYIYRSEGSLSFTQSIDLSLGDGCCQADPAHQEDVFQQGDEDGDRLVRLHLSGGAQHPHVRVRVTSISR